jgi:type IV secretory pathway TrbD component
MGARGKLNVAFLNGSVFVAALVGFLFKSWVAFGFVLALLLIGNFIMGEIRPGKRRRE